MTDEGLFEFLSEDLKISSDDIVSGYIAINVMELKRIDRIPQ